MRTGSAAPGCPAEAVQAFLRAPPHTLDAREPGVPPLFSCSSRNADNKETSARLQGSGTRRGAQSLPQLCVCKQPS